MNKAPEKLRFEPSSHSYWLGSRRLPSITQIIREAGLCGEINEYVDMSKGTAVHALTAKYDRGETVRLFPGSENDCYLEGWKRFLKEVPFEIDLEGIEKPRFNELFWFAGILDRSGTFRGQPALVEIKTGPYKPWHKIQTALQAMLLDMDNRFKTFRPVVYLDGKGGYQLNGKNKYSTEDFVIAHSVLGCANWRIKNNCFWSKEER